MKEDSTAGLGCEREEPATQRATQSPTYYDYFFVCIAAQIYTFAYFFRASIAPIADVLEEEFDATTSQIGLCSAFILLGYASMQIPAGMLLQIYSPELVSLTCSIAMGISSILFGISQNVIMASATQLLSGIAQAATAISVFTTVDRRLGSEMVPFAIGIVCLYLFCSLLLMQYLQALIYEKYSVWRPIFYCFGAICIVIGVISLFALKLEARKLRESKVSTDFNLNQSNDSTTNHQNNNDTVRHQNGESIDSTSNIKTKETHSVFKLLRISLKNGINYIYALYWFLMCFVLYGFYGLWLISYLMLKYKYSRSTATLISCSFYAAMAVSSPFLGYLSKRYRRRKVFLVSAPILYATSLLIIYAPDSAPMYVVLGSTIVAGIGFGGPFAVFWAAVRESNMYYQCEDVTMGIINSMSNSSGFVSQYLIGFILEWQWNGTFDDDGTRIYSVSDYDTAFITLSVCFSAAFVMSLFMKETRAKAIDYSKQ